MLYLLWSLLNIGLFLLFIVTSVRATKLLREKFGIFTSVVFIIGLLSFMNHSEPSNVNANSGQIKSWKFQLSDSINRNSIAHVKIKLEGDLILQYNLYIEYGKDSLGQSNIPISAFSTRTGSFITTDWETQLIQVEMTNDKNKFNYNVYGVERWKLLGGTIITRYREFKGVALIR